MRVRSVAVVVALSCVAASSRADDAADKRFKDAFKPLKLPSAAKVEKDAVPLLPEGIVTDAAPFRNVIDKLLAPYDTQLAARDQAAADLASAADPVGDVVLAAGAAETENAELAARVATVEASYGDVWDADYMASSEKVHRARKLAAVLIPFYRTIEARNVASAAKAAEALAKNADGARVARLVAATGDPSPTVRAVAVAALGRVGGDQALAALKNSLAGDQAVAVRTAALAALCSIPTGRWRNELIAAVADPAWEVRALAAAVCAQAKALAAVGPLIAQIEKEDGRLRKDLDDALQKLTGTRFYGDAALWKKWWAENQDRVTKEALAAAANEPDKAVGPPESWDQGAAAAGVDADAKGATSSFFGIATCSKRILFVVDVSFSMLDAAGAKPAAPTGTAKDAYPGPTGGSKMDVARWQLHRAIAALPKDASFDLVLFSESYKLWLEQPVLAADKAKAKAHEFVDAIKPNGTTNICDSLDKALELAAGGALGAKTKGARPESAFDTVFLMTDGLPNRGRVTDEDALLESVIARNRAARLVFHTIGIGEAADSKLLKALAARTGGQFIGFK